MTKLKSLTLTTLILGFTAAIAAAQPQTLFPTNGAKEICPDTTLRISFSSPMTMGITGKIQIFDADTNAVVDAIDVTRADPAPAPSPSRISPDRAAPTLVRSVGGRPGYNYYPVIIDRNEAQIFPAPGALAYGKNYYVTIDAGVFKDDKGISDKGSWRFSTRAAAPKPGAAQITVAGDSSGDFATIQGAIDFVPDGNKTPTTIFIKKGLYTELIYVTNKHGLTFKGEDRKQTVIEYATNDRFNSSAGGGGYRRGVFRAANCEDLVLTNLSVRNTTAYSGSQAEAIIFNGSLNARAIVTKVDLYSYQDTLQINGQAYISDCYIEGDVDFMWGTGPCFFENCEAKSLNSGRYYTQIRNRATNHGYVYYKCSFTGAQGIMGNFLSRIAPQTFPASEVVLIDCVLTSAVGPAAWRFDDRTEGKDVHFWEYNSHTPDGAPADTSQRFAASKQLKKPDDAATIDNYSNAKWVLGEQWDPKQAAVFQSQATSGDKPAVAGAIRIVNQPANQLALLGTSPILTVRATGGANLKYQWFKDGRAIPGATADLLQMPNADWRDAGCYLATASSGSAMVTSDAVTLTMVAPAKTSNTSTPPQLPAIPDKIFNVTANGAKGDGTTDNTAALQKTIAAAIDAGGGVVRIPAADKPYLSGPISLGNNVNLQIDAGAVLQALPYSAENPVPAGSYPLSGNRYTDFVNASNAHDVAITGAGQIEGQGQAWWQGFRANPQMPHRPFMVRFSGCNNVLISGIKLTNSPMFHVAMGSTNNLTVFGINIASPVNGPNTDGIDPSGEHQLFQNLHVSVGDDHLVMKPGGAYCSDILISDCWFGQGHGMSVGGQSNRGLDGMTVRNLYFETTETGLRLKADPTQGGEVKNISYSNIVMHDVDYPIVFYSYYRSVGNPGSNGGGNEVTLDKAKTWNATPPNRLNTNTMPSWKNLTISNLVASGTKKYSIIFGLPLGGYYIDNVKLNNVHLDGPGLKLFDVTNVQFLGDTSVSKVIPFNALAITAQPQPQFAAPGGSVSFTVKTAGNSGVNDKPPTFQWNLGDKALKDGKQENGSTIEGATTDTLKISNAQAGDAGNYTVTVSNNLDAFDNETNALVADKAPTSATSAAAALTVNAQ